MLLYVNDVQRGIDQPAIDQFYGRQQPDHVVNIHGIDYVYVYRNPLRQVKTPQIALPVELGDGLRLLGYDLDTTDARPGGKLRVNLYWQSERRTDVSYTVFTHLLDGEGRLIGQYDSVPLKGELPTRKWYSGQTVVDPVEIEIGTDAPPGPYSLAVGMYELESLQRLAAYDAQGQRLPGDQVVISGISPTAQP